MLRKLLAKISRPHVNLDIYRENPYASWLESPVFNALSGRGQAFKKLFRRAIRVKLRIWSNEIGLISPNDQIIGPCGSLDGSARGSSLNIEIYGNWFLLGGRIRLNVLPGEKCAFAIEVIATHACFMRARGLFH